MQPIEFPARSLHPIENWYEKVEPYTSAVNSQGDVLSVSDTLFCYDIVIILKTGKIERVELPELTHY